MDMKLPHFDLKSKAFRRGFLDGFTAHFVYFRDHSATRAFEIDASLEGAWRLVGSALREADRVERGKLGKRTIKASEKESAAA